VAHLVRFRADFDLAEYELVTMGGRGHQVHLGAVGGDRAAYRLPVDRDRELFRVGSIGVVGVGRPCGGGRPVVDAPVVAVACRCARSASQEPIAASTAAASAPVRTRHSVVFDGPPDGGVAYSQASSSAGTSATQPAIAVNERIPASTAAAHNVNTTATG
jgi:hypothetical protein